MIEFENVDGGKIWIAPEHIVSFYLLDAGGMDLTIIETINGKKYQVMEKPEFILQQINQE